MIRNKLIKLTILKRIKLKSKKLKKKLKIKKNYRNCKGIGATLAAAASKEVATNNLSILFSPS